MPILQLFMIICGIIESYFKVSYDNLINFNNYDDSLFVIHNYRCNIGNDL